jgi:hypothetical protein
MSYYLRGSDGDFQGLGAITPPVYEDCGFDAACIARNNVKQEAYNMAVLSETRQKQLAFCLSDPGYSAQQCHAQFDPGGFQDQTANAGEAVTTQAAPVTAPVTPPPVNQVRQSGGRVTFTSSRGTNDLQIGDTWLVAITGATPNAPVMVNAGGSTTQMGTTDSNGNFSLAGTARSADVGTWNEMWTVGGQPSGSFAFTVAAPPSAVQTTTQTPVTTPTIPGAPLQPSTSAGASASSMVIGGFDLSAIPIWAWAGAAAVALLAFGGGRGR